jgi:hypothetical protein
MSRREEFLQAILNERLNQHSLPGSEYDVTNFPNDWVAIASKYLAEESRCKGIKPTKQAFQESLIKAGAVILAALEHIDHMEKEGRFK